MNANITNAQRKAIYRRDGFRCARCDSTQGIQVHHYIPRGKGGSNSPHNLITLCCCCHAQTHGSIIYDSQTATKEDMEQYIVEYLADIYAPDWNPYRRE